MSIPCSQRTFAWNPRLSLHPGNFLCNHLLRRLHTWHPKNGWQGDYHSSGNSILASYFRLKILMFAIMHPYQFQMTFHRVGIHVDVSGTAHLTFNWSPQTFCVPFSKYCIKSNKSSNSHFSDAVIDHPGWQSVLLLCDLLDSDVSKRIKTSITSEIQHDTGSFKSLQ